MKYAIVAFLVNYLVSPFMRFWCRISVVNRNWIRRVKGKNQVPVVYFRNVRGELVILFCVPHLAAKGFYEEILRSVTDKEERGASVLYEMLRCDNMSEQALNTVRQHAKNVSDEFLSLGLSSQYAVIIPKDEWINADITLEEYLRSGESHFEEKGIMPERFRKWHTAACMNFLAEYSFAEELFEKYVKRMSCKIRQDKRNMIAVRQAVTCIRNGDREVVMLWGPRHLPGIKRLLFAEGFREEKRKWLTAYDALPIPEV